MIKRFDDSKPRTMRQELARPRGDLSHRDRVRQAGAEDFHGKSRLHRFDDGYAVVRPARRKKRRS